MIDSITFTVDVVRAISKRVEIKLDEIGLLVASGERFQEWLVWEAFLACCVRSESYPYCEVVAKPTYASEGVIVDDSSARQTADLRVGGPNDGANHCWAMIELVLVQQREDTLDASLQEMTTAIGRLRQLGWKKSAALLIVVAINPSAELTHSDVWQRPTVLAPLLFTIPGQGTLIIKAFDVKQDPANILTVLSPA